MTLTERLSEIRAAAKTRISHEAQAIMQRAVEEVRASGILARVAKVGDRAPDFTLANEAGQLVALQDLLARGPVVLSFYRGRW
jgi:hypothetical protein